MNPPEDRLIDRREFLRDATVACASTSALLTAGCRGHIASGPQQAALPATAAPEECDVCVIGSGAGGALAAYALAKAGLRTVVLEKGVWRDEGDSQSRWDWSNDNDEVYNRLRKVSEPGSEANPYEFTSTRFGGAVAYSPAQIGQGFGVVGGATVFYAACAWRFRERDFKKRTYYGDRLSQALKPGWPSVTLADWPDVRDPQTDKPISFYDAIEPYYGRAEFLVGISGDHTRDPLDPPNRRPTVPDEEAPSLQVPTYMAPLPYEAINKIVEKAAIDSGYTPFPIPLAIHSVQDLRKHMNACVSCNFCSGYPCTWRAKSGVDQTVLEYGLRRFPSMLSVLTSVTARRIETRLVGNTRTCTSVLYTEGRPEPSDAPGKTPRPKRLTCKIVVLAAGGILSPRLLMLSGLASKNAPVGQNLMFHVDDKREGRFRGFDPGADGAFRLVKKLAIMDGYYPLPTDPFINHASIQMGSKGGPVGFAQGRKNSQKADMIGKDLLDAVRAYPESYDLQAMVEDLPQLANRVDLDDQRVDPFGDPLPRITHKFHPMDVVARDAAFARIDRVLRQANADVPPVDPNPPEAKIEKLKPSGVHTMGTLRMGTDKGSSVVDEYCRLHDTANLFVVDASVFPSSAGVNPALTVQANALRVADYIVRQRAQGGL